jgi:hypothetical protein
MERIENTNKKSMMVVSFWFFGKVIGEPDNTLRFGPSVNE